ncbi:MAG: glycosyltransferase family 2 protein [Synechococcaceae cyanobacterium SM2_3_1]|nr:glycosyltransferase family 2 protein [Synechococcaceae cyanobacterium SM2_3_1]
MGSYHSTTARIGIVIPTLEEEETIASCLAHLQLESPPFEVIIADGGSQDFTLDRVADMKATLTYPLHWGVAPERGRAVQMNWGAQQTDAPILLFLHADSRLPAGGLEAIRRSLEDPQIVGGRFRVQLDSQRWPYPLFSRAINWRSQFTGYFTGDMGIFIRHQVFAKLGGYPCQPLMEDLELSGRMQTWGQRAFLEGPILTSSRRWQRHGPWRTIALMQILRFSYRLGARPEDLVRWYRDVR